MQHMYGGERERRQNRRVAPGVEKMADFEEAPVAALQQVFGTVSVAGCWFLSRVSTLTRDIDIAIPSVRLSVCPSVTRWYCMKTA